MARGIPFSRISTVPDKKSAGHTKLLCAVQKLGPMHRRGIVAMAGMEAQHQADPCGTHGHHGASDRKLVANYALRCIGNAEQAQLLAHLWRVQARDFVKAHWDAIHRVAIALLEQQTLNTEEVRRLVFTMPTAGDMAA